MFGYIFYRFVQYILFCSFLIGSWFLFSPFFLPGVKKAYAMSRFRVRVNSNTYSKKKSALFEHINMLLYVVFNKKFNNGAISFIAISISLFITMVVLIYNSFTSKVFVILFSLLWSLIPYIVLLLRLRTIRVEGSYEAEGLITELVNQYKINSLNMIEAIDRTAIRIKDCKYSQRALFRLSYSLKSYKNASELDYIINEFVYSFDTEWATLLGMNIHMSVSDGTDVRVSLDDILTKLAEIRKLLENEKRYNHEAFSMIRFVVPGVYLLSIYFANSFFSFPVSKFLHYQFETQIGLRMAIITFSTMVINFIILYVFKKPKYDF
jgi:hypothetical protein